MKKKSSAVKPQARSSRFSLLHDVARLRRIVMDDLMRPFGITSAQFLVLSALSRGENSGRMQTDLAHELELGKVTIGGLLERLEKSGQVERRADDNDGRAKRVFITDKGYETILLLNNLIFEVDKRLIRGLSAEETEVTEMVLSRFRLNLRSMITKDCAAEIG